MCVSQSIKKERILGERTVQFGKRERYMNAQAFSLPPMSAVEVIELVLSVCASVCEFSVGGKDYQYVVQEVGEC